MPGRQAAQLALKLFDLILHCSTLGSRFCPRISPMGGVAQPKARLFLARSEIVCICLLTVGTSLRQTCPQCPSQSTHGLSAAKPPHSRQSRVNWPSLHSTPHLSERHVEAGDIPIPPRGLVSCCRVSGIFLGTSLTTCIRPCRLEGPSSRRRPWPWPERESLRRRRRRSSPRRHRPPLRR